MLLIITSRTASVLAALINRLIESA